jgi:L-aminopeptidase/D-esterase-like protein
MICYEFKGGNGTASRVVSVAVAGGGDPGRQEASRAYTVGVFLQANFGRRPQLVIAGVPVGQKIPGQVYKSASADPSGGGQDLGSCIAVVATDAPLLPNQLKRLARRVSLGLARTGTISGNSSGDLFIAFSTANPNVASPDQITHDVQTIPNDLMDPLFAGVAQATEEAVINALVDNHSMTGRDNHRVEALPHARLREIIKRFR